MTIEGLLKKVFLGGQAWIVESDDGTTWQIKGEVAANMENQRVIVEGQPADEQFGITMVGPIFKADSIRVQ